MVLVVASCGATSGAGAARAAEALQRRSTPSATITANWWVGCNLGGRITSPRRTPLPNAPRPLRSCPAITPTRCVANHFGDLLSADLAREHLREYVESRACPDSGQSSLRGRDDGTHLLGDFEPRRVAPMPPIPLRHRFVLGNSRLGTPSTRASRVTPENSGRARGGDCRPALVLISASECAASSLLDLLPRTGVETSGRSRAAS